MGKKMKIFTKVSFGKRDYKWETAFNRERASIGKEPLKQ